MRVLCCCALRTKIETPNDFPNRYVMGKSEGSERLWHGHVTAVTVAPAFRRQNLANKLMQTLEKVTEDYHEAYFVDLFVRASNKVAIEMYERFGYTAYRRVLNYYGEEDAFDMRKACKRDVTKSSVVRAAKFEQNPWEIEFD